ncbi:hypothetical protein BDW59DRAFT_77273 [Aspergillus cavernicola]|uniref:Mitochondrial respiratory complex I chaperone n=1 Tax=Aspergillus cavernicola TaxID=176166 RepID=A0ABR4IZM2_9EURO
MQSQLTKRVFRAIVNNEPLPISQCRNRFLHTVRPYRSRRAALGVPYAQRRELFAFNITSPSAPPSAILPSEAGLQPMRELERSATLQTRGPGYDVLAKAFQEFFETRSGEPGVITLFQASLLLRTWNHLHAHQQDMEPEDWKRVFSIDNLENLLFVISEAECLPDARDVICKVARFVFLELGKDHGSGRDQIAEPALLAFINIQALNGNPEEARHTVEKMWYKLRDTTPSPWLTVMKGFAIAMTDGRRQIRQTVESLDKHGVKFDPASQEELIHFLIKRDLQAAVKTIYECPLSGDQEPSTLAKIAVSRYAILKADTAWAEPIFESISSGPVSVTIGIRLLWDATRGKDASYIAENVERWAAKNPDLMASLSISYVNDLIAYANSINNPTLAAAFTALAPRWGLAPDSQTRLLYLESRIQAGDVGGSLAFLEGLDEMDMTASKNLPLMNKLITMLCFSGQDDATVAHVSSFLDPLFENNVRLESDTITALTHMLAYRHDWEGVSELLRPRLGSYELEEKIKVRDVLTKFILDLEQESDQAWEAYGLLRLAFPETGVNMRTKIMTSFFKRGRGDLAYLVFGHMRQANDFAHRPKLETYTQCFQGFAMAPDLTRLELVHNMLKLDTEVDLNTRLLDWLMLAYTECDAPNRSMEIFRTVLQGEEGPSRRTISFFFKMCMKHSLGSFEAIKMMEKMKLLEVAVDRHLYMGYVEALAAHCEFDLAAQALDALKDVTGHAPTFHSIGQFYNAIPYEYWKDEVEKWAKEKYPDLWAQLEGHERTKDQGEGQKFILQSEDDSLL